VRETHIACPTSCTAACHILPHVLPPLLQNRLQNVNLLAAPLSTLLAKRQTYCFQGIFLHDVADSFHDYGRIVRYGYM
jgi:hypothetical protein